MVLSTKKDPPPCVWLEQFTEVEDGKISLSGGRLTTLFIEAGTAESISITSNTAILLIVPRPRVADKSLPGIYTRSDSIFGHKMNAFAPQVKPPPNATVTTKSPSPINPSSTASKSAMGTLAPAVFP